MRPSHVGRLPLSVLVGLVVLGSVSCGASPDASVAGDGPAAVDGNVDSEHEAASDLSAEFARAEAQWAVPAPLLMAIAYEETRWQMVQGEREFEDKEPGHGIMALTEDRIGDAALLTGFAAEDIRTSRLHNIVGAAALLAEAADTAGVDHTDLAAWGPIVAWYSGIERRDVQAHYVHDGVYRVLAEGVQSELGTLPATAVEADFQKPTQAGRTGVRSGAIWRPSPNNSSRPSGTSGDPSMIIVHTCEGSYAGCWGWLTNSQSGVSAHYVVNNSGSEVSQLVSESRKAWHIGARYDCSLNDDTDCWRNGGSSNNFTIGIEHAGYASQSSWSSGLQETSAQLVCDIADENDIPIDRYHVVGHGQLQPYNRVDPGANWPWSRYLSRAAELCGAASGGSSGGSGGSSGGSGGSSGGGGGSSGGGGVDIVIDSNPVLNGPDAEVEVSGSWTASNNVWGYYNTGYWWRSTGSSADGASFWFYLDAPATLTAEAWWAAATDRAPAAPFIVFDSADRELGRESLDQRTDGGRWNEIGTYDFPAGWNRVLLSRWTTPGYVVVADAVRVHTP